MYSSAVSACEKGERWELSVQLLIELRQCGLQGNVISYSSSEASLGGLGV